jgi:hypothetical protein
MESDDQQILNQVVDELFEAFQSKNKELGMQALRALVLHIQDEDKKQDQEDMSE